VDPIGYGSKEISFEQLVLRIPRTTVQPLAAG
jgi:hypothetical protein